MPAAFDSVVTSPFFVSGTVNVVAFGAFASGDVSRLGLP